MAEHRTTTTITSAAADAGNMPGKMKRRNIPAAGTQSQPCHAPKSLQECPPRPARHVTSLADTLEDRQLTDGTINKSRCPKARNNSRAPQCHRPPRTTHSAP
ncbi:hypothetical protein E2C01_080196 [Portunus trituberculatus]|uniref:Uncharacterized protein n=1 Tax=Portunus trituberculatus TaxID=210409 RepID=A0A5B7INM3_PORTR|nr:hypothetical protein [Portunus trituberculatus]